MLTAIAKLVESLNSLKESYNKYQKNLPDFGQFNVDIQREKTEVYMQTGFDVYKKKFEEMLPKIEALTKDRQRTINESKYPLRFGATITDQSFGESKRNSAFLFFNQFSENREAIFKELKTAKLSGDLDYMNNLLDVYISKYGDVEISVEGMNEGDFDTEKSNEAKFHNAIVSFREAYYKESGFDRLSNEILTLNKLKLQVNTFIDALDNKILLLLTSKDYGEMSDDSFFQLRQRFSDAKTGNSYQDIIKYAQQGI